MIHVFEELNKNLATWKVVDKRPLTQKELDCVTSVKVTEGQFGLQLTFYLIKGYSHLPLAATSVQPQIGEKINPKDIMIEKWKYANEERLRVSISNPKPYKIMYY